MSPEFRVVVPDNKRRTFKRAISLIDGAQILDESLSQEDRDVINREDAERFKKVLESLKKTKPRKVQTKINANYHRLLNDLVGEFSTLTRPIGTKELKKTFFEIFQNKLESKNAEALIIRYGLADGKYKIYEKVGRIIGHSAGGADQRIHRGLYLMRGFLTNANLIYRNF